MLKVEWKIASMDIVKPWPMTRFIGSGFGYKERLIIDDLPTCSRG
jgi:hypothetical protein